MVLCNPVEPNENNRGDRSDFLMTCFDRDREATSACGSCLHELRNIKQLPRYFVNMAELKSEKNISSIPIDGFSHLRITSIWTFLMSVQWSEPWLVGLLLFHAVCLCVTVVTCRFYRAQICHFLLMVGLVYSAEHLNELAAMNWRSFSNFQYFDSKGMFISLVYSIPLLLNTVIIVMVWVYRTFSTMTELKTLQLKRKVRREKRDKTD
ncbi:transmembrane protein 18 [Paralichthys olivaceus]|uniref:transmembrane protein 18 n=1 Tax=Paralichthys olivaceus TaxID=8255 RepID=UPI0037537F32